MPSWVDFLFCAGQQKHFITLLYVWKKASFTETAKNWDCLTCISSRIPSTEPERCPRKANARIRLRTLHPFLPQTENRWISKQNTHSHTYILLKGLDRRPTCIDLSYQRFAPFFSRPPPCSISRALVVSLGSRPLGSSRHTKHRQLSIRARESRLVWSGEGAKVWGSRVGKTFEATHSREAPKNLLSARLWLVPIQFSRQMSRSRQGGASPQRFLPFSGFSPAARRSPSRRAACCLRRHPTRKTSEKNRLKESCVSLYHCIVWKCVFFSCYINFYCGLLDV